jgi:pyridoxal phosphate enzyme (YggS family)
VGGPQGVSTDIAANLDRVRRNIERAARRAGRDPADVTLVAATKSVGIDVVRRAVDAGISDLGENYVSELRRKTPELPSVRWHFIGVLQTNTARHVAALADVVQTVSGERATRRLAMRTTDLGRTLDVLIEVDLTGERHGARPEDTESFAGFVQSLPGLRLVGLMTLPPVPETPEQSRPYFERLRDLRDLVARNHPSVLELSMGMSLDYEAAIEEGATIVRVGTALFGERPPA